MVHVWWLIIDAWRSAKCCGLMGRKRLWLPWLLALGTQIPLRPPQWRAHLLRHQAPQRRGECPSRGTFRRLSFPTKACAARWRKQGRRQSTKCTWQNDNILRFHWQQACWTTLQHRWTSHMPRCLPAWDPSWGEEPGHCFTRVLCKAPYISCGFPSGHIFGDLVPLGNYCNDFWPPCCDFCSFWIWVWVKTLVLMNIPKVNQPDQLRMFRNVTCLTNQTYQQLSTCHVIKEWGKWRPYA